MGEGHGSRGAFPLPHSGIPGRGAPIWVSVPLAVEMVGTDLDESSPPSSTIWGPDRRRPSGSLGHLPYQWRCPCSPPGASWLPMDLKGCHCPASWNQSSRAPGVSGYPQRRASGGLEGRGLGSAELGGAQQTSPSQGRAPPCCSGKWPWGPW